MAIPPPSPRTPQHSVRLPRTNPGALSRSGVQANRQLKPLSPPKPQQPKLPTPPSAPKPPTQRVSKGISMFVDYGNQSFPETDIEISKETDKQWEARTNRNDALGMYRNQPRDMQRNTNLHRAGVAALAAATMPNTKRNARILRNAARRGPHGTQARQGVKTLYNMARGKSYTQATSPRGGPLNTKKVKPSLDKRVAAGTQLASLAGTALVGGAGAYQLGRAGHRQIQHMKEKRKARAGAVSKAVRKPKDYTREELAPHYPAYRAAQKYKNMPRVQQADQHATKATLGGALLANRAVRTGVGTGGMPRRGDLRVTSAVARGLGSRRTHKNMLNYMARNPNGALRARASVHNTLGAAGEAGFTGYQAARAAHRVKQHRAGKENPRYKPEYAQYYDEKLPDKRKKTAVKKSIAALPPGTNSRKARRATNRYTTSRNKAYARGTRSTPGMPMSGKVVGSNVGPGSSNSLGHRIKRAKKRAGARAKIEYGMWSNPPQFESLPRASSSRSGFKVTNVPKMNKRKKKLIAIGAGVGAGAALGTGGYALYRNRQKKEPVRKALDLGMNFNPVGRNIEMYPVEDDDLEFQKSVHSAASKEHRRPEPFSAERKRLKRGRAYSNAAAIGGGAALVGSGAAGYKAYRSGKRAFQPGAIRTKQLAAASKPLGAAAGLGALGAAGLYGSKKISDKYRRGHAQSYR